MIIISFPVTSVHYSHDIQTFLNLGFKITDDEMEGSFLQLPKNWLASYQYHTPFEFSIVIRDGDRRIRAYASLHGSIANVELLNRYKILNYKPWLSPGNSELRLIDNATGNILFAEKYYPKHHSSKDSKTLCHTAYSNNTERYGYVYQNLLNFCKQNNINLESNATYVDW